MSLSFIFAASTIGIEKIFSISEIISVIVEVLLLAAGLVSSILSASIRLASS